MTSSWLADAAPGLSISALLGVLAALCLGEARRIARADTRGHPGAGRPHSNHVGTAAGDRAAIRQHDQEQQMDDTEKLAFTTRVLELFSLAYADAYDDLFWRVDDGQLHLYANVSDVFDWGSADAEEITPGTLPVLEQAFLDLRPHKATDHMAILYAARQRGMRPQGAVYPVASDRAWCEVSALYDACGPERQRDLDNPKTAAAHATTPTGDAR